MGDTDEVAVDGRSLRRVRSQDAVVTAMLDLLTEGHTQPTAQDVSDRSGVSMRSIFRLFEDIESLHRTAIARQVERVVPLLADLSADGPFASRVAALVGNRSEVFEMVSPVRRLAVRLAPQSPPIREELARFGRFFRQQVADVFGAELARAKANLRAGADDDTLLDAVDAATSWEAWERLRTAQGLSVPDASRVVTFTVSALLAGAGTE
jgi:AcrR family transcriptional regulator